MAYFGGRQTGGSHLIQRILRSSFLEELDPGDTEALAVLATRATLGVRDHLQPLLDHPALKAEGITDQFVPRLITLSRDVTEERGLDVSVLDPGQFHLDSTAINLPRAGEVQIHVLREPEYLKVPVSRRIAVVIPSLEELMGEPFPANTVVVVVADLTKQHAAGTHYKRVYRS